MKILFLTGLLIISHTTLAKGPEDKELEQKDYWKLYENYASSNIAKYHDVLFSLQKGNTEEAKAKLLRYQREEVQALNKLAEHHKLSDTSQEIISLVEDYQAQEDK